MTSQFRRISTRSSSVLAFIGLVFLTSGAATWFLRPSSKRTASAQLHIAAEPPYILFQPETDRANNDAQLRNQIFLIKDRSVLVAALRHLPKDVRLKLEEEQTDPVQWLEDALTVDFPSQGFIRISLSGERPDDLKEIVAAVTMAYLENYVNKDRIEHEEQRRKLEMLRQKFEEKWRPHKDSLRALRQMTVGDKKNRTTLSQRITLEDLRSIEKDLAQVRQELRRLRIELSMHPDWFDEVWSRYVAALNCQPGPGLPVNHALVALFHDDAHLLHQAEQKDRPQKKERLRLLTAMEKAFLREAENLDAQIQQTRESYVDLSELQENIDREKKTLQLIDDKLLKLEVEQQAPRISWPSKEPFLSPPDATKRKMMTGAAAALASLGLLLLCLAGIQFRYSKAS